MNEIPESIRKELELRIKNYPSLYASGGDVLNSILCASNKPWVNGWIVEDDPVEDQSEKYSSWENYKKYLEGRIGSIDYLDMEVYWKKQYREYLEIRNTAYERSKNIELTIPHYYPISNYSTISNVPEDVSEDWKIVIEMFEKVLEHNIDFYEYEKRKKIAYHRAELKRLTEEKLRDEEEDNYLEGDEFK